MFGKEYDQNIKKSCIYCWFSFSYNTKNIENKYGNIEIKYFFYDLIYFLVH